MIYDPPNPTRKHAIVLVEYEILIKYPWLAECQLENRNNCLIILYLDSTLIYLKSSADLLWQQ